MVKYLVAPARMPDELTWFKWEAYTTWLSGFALLVVVYYLGAELYLIDKSVLDLTAPTAAAVAFGSLVLAWLALRGAVPLAARPQRGCARAGGLRVPGRAHLRLHPCVQRARRLYPDRRADRHHHGGERVRHHHPEPEEDRGRAAGGKGAGSGLGRGGQAALGAQQLPHAAGRLPDDRQPLSADVRDPLQLADRRHRAGDRARSSATSSIPATRAKAARGGPGAWRPPAWSAVGMALRRRPACRAAPARGQASTLPAAAESSSPAAACAIWASRSGRACTRRPMASLLDSPEQHPPSCPPDRHQRGAFERHAARQRHRDDRRRSAKCSPPGSPPARRRR